MAIRDIIGIAILGSFVYFTLGYLFINYIIPFVARHFLNGSKPNDFEVGIMFIGWPGALAIIILFIVIIDTIIFKGYHMLARLGRMIRNEKR